MGTQRKEDGLPKRIRQGHRKNCPGCEYTGKNLIDHLEKDHPEARKRYEKARRGVWVLTDDGGSDSTEGDGVRDEDENEEGELEDLREELREKEKRIEDLRETRDKLADISEETLERIPEEDQDKAEPRVGDNGNAGGETETTSKEQATEQIKVGLREAFEETVEMEEGRN
jgi:chromosome segregation ATPase